MGGFLHPDMRIDHIRKKRDNSFKKIYPVSHVMDTWPG